MSNKLDTGQWVTRDTHFSRMEKIQQSHDHALRQIVTRRDDMNKQTMRSVSALIEKYEGALRKNKDIFLRDTYLTFIEDLESILIVA